MVNISANELILESLMFQIDATENYLSYPYDDVVTEHTTNDGWKYCKNSRNELHNRKGPAIITSENTGTFYINGIELDPHDWVRYAEITDEEKAYLLFVVDAQPVKLGP
jgi:hypothetical protein